MSHGRAEPCPRRPGFPRSAPAARAAAAPWAAAGAAGRCPRPGCGTPAADAPAGSPPRSAPLLVLVSGPGRPRASCPAKSGFTRPFVWFWRAPGEAAVRPVPPGSGRQRVQGRAGPAGGAAWEARAQECCEARGRRGDTRGTR